MPLEFLFSIFYTLNECYVEALVFLGWNRQTDISLVMLVIVVPLMLVLPLIVPWRVMKW